MTAPFAPWALAGEVIVGLARAGPSARSTLPPGIRPFPGPFLVVAARYASSPVGSYLELALGEPARLGARPGWCVTTMVVDSPDARVGGRLNWGFPKELGTLRWFARDRERELVWEERDMVVRGQPHGPTVPVVVPLRNLQHRGDGPVVVPGRVRGRAAAAGVTVHVFPGDPLNPLAGRHPGTVVSGMQFRVDEARHPTGLMATLRAPLRAPEPALTSPTPGD